MKETYEDITIEVIEFDQDDMVVTSGDWGEMDP